MVSLRRLHKNATQNMKEYFFGFIHRTSYGKFDTQNVFANKLKDHNTKLIQRERSGSSVDVELEWEKLLIINIANDYINNSPDTAEKIARATTLRTAIIAELDSGVDAFYTSTYNFDTLFTTP